MIDTKLLIDLLALSSDPNTNDPVVGLARAIRGDRSVCSCALFETMMKLLMGRDVPETVGDIPVSEIASSLGYAMLERLDAELAAGGDDYAGAVSANRAILKLALDGVLSRVDYAQAISFRDEDAPNMVITSDANAGGTDTRVFTPFGAVDYCTVYEESTDELHHTFEIHYLNGRRALSRGAMDREDAERQIRTWLLYPNDSQLKTA